MPGGWSFLQEVGVEAPSLGVVVLAVGRVETIPCTISPTPLDARAFSPLMRLVKLLVQVVGRQSTEEPLQVVNEHMIYLALLVTREA